MYYLRILMEKMERSTENQPVRLFDDPNLLPGSEGEYAPLYSDCQVIQCVYCSPAHILLMGMVFRNEGCFTSKYGKRLLFIVHMNKVIIISSGSTKPISMHFKNPITLHRIS